ncbi:hypothetical protein HC752_16365 [Vibrio sp. S9_S30]|uniref:hypothetical protein n=1 Tax=Vibrio sp. S9_S30 TaxID=2720226 RepID=UPI0016806712|nr:hypothetical protein [Vibrio sp. S9_S30]MBD1558511.1 hypothetical protein [Vibrio sp. S9_S30]
MVFSLEEYHEYFDDEDADEFFLHLSSLRAELLQGDWRLLYLMWLRALDGGSDVAPIPMVGFDFDRLSEPQLAFVTLFDVPLGMLKALTLALQDRASHCPIQNSQNSSAWLSQLSEKEKDHLLTALFEQGELSRSQAMAMTRKGSELEHLEYAHWLDGQVIAPYIDIAEAQLEKEQAIAMAKRLAEEKVAKEAKLSEVYSQRDQVWLRIQEQANRACASGYDHASNDLHQLAEACQFMDKFPAFERRFNDFILEHKKRKALIKRLQALLTASVLIQE